MLLTLGYFILALLLLVLIHEYGHFLVARLCGVKVLRFSFGFGKVLARWQGKKGTEYVWSLFPIGGYVKLLDGDEMPVPPSERHLAFNLKPLWARVAVVIAGPLFNFLFAILALWLVLVIGTSALAPIISKVEPNSIAAKIGLQSQDELQSFAGKEIHNWRDFQFALLPFIGSDETVSFKVKSEAGSLKNLQLPFGLWKIDSKPLNLFVNLGITPFIPKIPAIVGDVMYDSPAEKAGILPSDLIKKIGDKPIKDWLELVEYTKNHKNEEVSLLIERKGQNKTISLKIASANNIGFIGVRSSNSAWPKHWLRVNREAPLPALKTAIAETFELTLGTFKLMGRFFTGEMPLHNVSGPLGIAEGAGVSGRAGLVDYLSFLAIISISLGALNLLPIPLLDGGHLLYYLIEVIIRRPVSPAFKAVGSYVGLMLLIAVMLIAFSNDISRLY